MASPPAPASGGEARTPPSPQRMRQVGAQCGLCPRPGPPPGDQDPTLDPEVGRVGSEHRFSVLIIVTHRLTDTQGLAYTLIHSQTHTHVHRSTRSGRTRCTPSCHMTPGSCSVTRRPECAPGTCTPDPSPPRPGWGAGSSPHPQETATLSGGYVQLSFQTEPHGPENMCSSPRLWGQGSPTCRGASPDRFELAPFPVW